VDVGKLQPCPFCGGDAAPGHISYSRPLDDTNWEDGSPVTEAHFVGCVRCGAVSRSGIVSGYQTKAEAIERWNTRTNNHAELVEALRFYADPDAWNQPPIKTVHHELLGPAYENAASKVRLDRGNIARKALSLYGEGGK
jgi:hypothetical protein